jgi:hypothetical protein
MPGIITDEVAREARVARDRRLREDFRSRLDSSCAVMVDHFYGLCKTARVDCEEEASGALPTGSSSAATQQFSEQEELRRSGFHAMVHAERLASAGAVN